MNNNNASRGHFLLINPWIVDFAAFDFWAKPVGLLKIAQALRSSGYQISFLDCLDRLYPDLPKFKRNKSTVYGTGHYYKEIVPRPDILNHIPRRLGRYGVPYERVDAYLRSIRKPDAIFITSGMTYWYPGIRDLVLLLRKHFGSTPIILGGVYATLCTEHALKHTGVDRVVSGPGVQVSIQIADEITGSASSNSSSELIWPAYDLYPKLESVAITGSYGCPYRCPFCASHLLAPYFQRREPQDVVDEIIHWHQTREVLNFAFYDDALLWKKDQHLIPILNLVHERKMPLYFHTPNGLHPKYIDAYLAKLMFETGFRTLRLSYESRNPERQNEMGGKVTDLALETAVSILKNAGFDATMISSYVLMGLPGQTLAEIIDSILFVLGLQIPVSLASFSPIPGTQSWLEAVEKGGIARDADPLLTNNSIYPLCTNSAIRAQLENIRALTNEANLTIKKGKNPFAETQLMDSFHEIIKSYGKIAIS